MKRFVLILLTFIAFISLGLPDGLLGVAWPSIADEFGLPLDFLGILLVSATSGYIVSSFFTGTFHKLIGVGKLLAFCCFVTAFSLLAYVLTPLWQLMLCFSFSLGFGGGAIDAAINMYVDEHFSQKVMQWLHASFGIGVTIGPAVMTFGLRYLQAWRFGYISIALFQFVLSVVFFLNHKRWIEPHDEKIPEQAHNSKTKISDTLKIGNTYLGILLFFIYTGVEFALGLWCFTLLTKARGFDESVAGITVSAFYAMFTGGRIVAGIISHLTTTFRLLLVSLVLALCGTNLIILNLHPVSTIAGYLLAGFAIGPIFPALVTDTASRVGKLHAKNSIGMQISAAGLGTAVLPSLAGILAEREGLDTIPYVIASAIIVSLLLFISSHLIAAKIKL